MSDANGHHGSPGHEMSVDRQEALAGLSGRLHDIESRPLAARADAFAEVHDDLRAVLEGADHDRQGGR